MTTGLGHSWIDVIIDRIAEFNQKLAAVGRVIQALQGRGRGRTTMGAPFRIESQGGRTLG